VECAKVVGVIQPNLLGQWILGQDRPLLYPPQLILIERQGLVQFVLLVGSAALFLSLNTNKGASSFFEDQQGLKNSNKVFQPFFTTKPKDKEPAGFTII